LEEVDDVNAAVADAIKSLSEAIAQQGQQKIVVPAPQVKVDMQPVEAAVKEMTKAIREDIASRNYDIVRTDASGQEVHYTRVPKS
jgi:tyrosine-protein phosphatase YwqE